MADEARDSDGPVEDEPSEEPQTDGGLTRPVATIGVLYFLIVFLFVVGRGYIHGWTWVAAVGIAILVSWASSFVFVPTPFVARVLRWLKPGAEKIGSAVTFVWSFIFLASTYLWLVTILPFDEDALDWVVRLPVVTQLGILVFWSIVTLHFIYPLVEPKRRARLAWMSAQGSLAHRSLVPLFGVAAISTAILLASHTLLVLAEHGVIRFYAAPPAADTASLTRTSLAALLDGGDVAWLLVWHLCEMVPALDVNETLQFGQPLYYTDRLTGAVVLLFKIFVGLGAIATAVAIIEEYRAPSVPEARAVSLLPATTMRLLDRKLGNPQRPEPMKADDPGKEME
jgi:hypothetical protein